MARIRTIKPDFFTSEDIVELEPMARLLYIALWCEADREGRMAWKPRTFKMRYLPGDDCDIDALCDALVKRGLVCLYGDGLAFIPSFGAHQHVNPREAKSVLPDPPGWVAENPSGPARGDIRSIVLERDGHQCVRCWSSDKLEIDHILPQSAGGPTVVENLRTLCKPCNGKRPVSGEALRQDLANDGYSFDELREKYRRVLTRADASNLDLTRREEGKGKERKVSMEGRVDDATEPDREPERKSRKKPRQQIPDGFKFSDRVRAYGAKLGFTGGEVDREEQRFTRHAKQNGRICADWDMAGENWMDKAAEFAGKPLPADAEKAKEALQSMFYAKAESPQLDAWDEHYRAVSNKSSAPRDRNGGWFFKTEWPPGHGAYKPSEDLVMAPQATPQLRSMGH